MTGSWFQRLFAIASCFLLATTVIAADGFDIDAIQVDIQQTTYGDNQPRAYGYGGQVTLDTPVRDTDEFKKIANKAWANMKEARRIQTQKPGALPGVMTTLTTDGKTLYFHSSIKGASSEGFVKLQDPNISSDLKQFMEDCLKNEQGDEIPHKRQANCGEYGAMNLWEQHNRGKKISEQPGTVVTYRKLDTIINPCSAENSNEKGCEQVLTSTKLRAILESEAKITMPMSNGVICEAGGAISKRNGASCPLLSKSPAGSKKAAHSSAPSGFATSKRPATATPASHSASTEASKSKSKDSKASKSSKDSKSSKSKSSNKQSSSKTSKAKLAG